MDDQRTPPRGYRIPALEAPPPPAPPPGGPLGWLRRHPGAALTAIVVALMVGLAAGFLVGGTQAGDKKRADKAEARLAAVEKQRDGLRARADDAEAKAGALRQRLKELRSRGQVPSFVGDQVSDVEADHSVITYKWKIKTTDEFSDRSPGTVLSQSPAEGTILKAGETIRLVVAKKPPPQPKQWVEIESFSGAGATKTGQFKIRRGVKARLVYDMPQDGANSITLFRVPSEYVDLIVSEVGPKQGTKRLREPGTFYCDVTGAYTIRIEVFKRPP